MDSRIAVNRRLWNEWARIHQESAFYDMAGFRAGQTSLKHIELEEVGDVAGKSLLHLQCHFGQDTLS
ncbi:MAG TPA: class I SAM-dependent methyltransferase, partial [Dongiaceae bacterium]|nr:class I SAM-dependent methyltransferase [Dongiaceae bacterium]